MTYIDKPLKGLLKHGLTDRQMDLYQYCSFIPFFILIINLLKLELVFLNSYTQVSALEPSKPSCVLT